MGKFDLGDAIRRSADSARVETMVEVALESGDWIKCEEAITLGLDSWRPHLIGGNDRPSILQVQLTDVLQPYLIRRLREAQSRGWRVHLAVEIGSLHVPSFVAALAGIDATIHIVTEGNALENGRDLLALLGLHGVALPHETRVRVARSAWERRQEGTASERGKRLEGLLAFLFGQVSGLRVMDLNFRTATEEIDVVLQCDHDDQASWYQPGVPFILIECKNWTSNVSSKDVSSFLVKVQFKRGRCRIGIMCSANGFTSDARNQELRLAATDYTIVLIGPDMIEDWIRSNDPKAWLDRCVRGAMLR